jgi:3,4-dihydroxy 2-butanone 4-phosphate synthase/GTP cyclohydrolase II
MVTSNTSLHETAFTVSVDLIGEGTTTGISAQDRSKTILALVNPNTRPDQLGRPGHIFPLKAVAGGVLRRTGHTEATIDLARLAGLQPAGALVEVMNEDGSMARLPQLLEIGARFGIKVISIKDLIDFRLRTDSLIEELVRVDMPTAFGHFTLVAFKEKLSGAEHLALVKGSWQPNEPVLTRVHSSCFTGDILSSLRCDCGEQLHNAMRKIEQEGKGVIVYMNQEGRGIGLINKLKAYQLQENGLDTVEANLQLGFGMDDRDYGVGAQILRYLGITQLRLLSNNPRKRAGLKGYGLEVTEVIPIETSPNSYNLKYLETKRDKLGHDILNKE